MSNSHLTNISFDQFSLHPNLLAGIRDCGFMQATPIQAATLPLALADLDIAGQAQTGTGKTATFLITAMNRLLRNPAQNPKQAGNPRTIILAPTRELAIQIHRDATLLNKYAGLRLGLAYGGVDYEKQRRELLNGVDILIGTPGRIIDFLKQRIFSLHFIEVMVLDEADRMFDLGFIKDIRYLLHHMPAPQKRLSLLFSATLSYRVMELAYEYMNNPQCIQIDPDQVTVETVHERVFLPANTEKIPLLLYLLKNENPNRCIIFTNTKRVAEYIANFLETNRFSCAILSGDVQQHRRQSLLRAFSAGDRPILVATDVAARGLHIPEVSHVINFDLPQSAADYVHRIGRTARAGTQGEAISFACEDTAFFLPEIEAYIGHRIAVSPIDRIDLPKPVQPPYAPRKRMAHKRQIAPTKRHQNLGQHGKLPRN